MLTSFARSLAKKTPAFDMTPAAAAQIKKLLKGDFENTMLRIGLKKGGCAGFSYDFSFDSAARKGDHLFKKDGAKVVLDDRTLLYLRRSKLDYKTDVFSSSFQIILPEGSDLHSCSCGRSVGKDGEAGECLH